jgi:SAM-dependent methyltransferase
MSDIQIPEDRAKRHGGDAFYSGGAHFTETLELWGGLNGSMRVLDIGCGPGRVAIGIGERYGWANDYTGFDPIQIDIEIATREITTKHPNFRFHHINAWNSHYNPGGTIQSHEVRFPAEDGSMDFVFAASVFTHMFKRDTAHYLAETLRVLKPGGTLYATWFVITERIMENCRTGKARFAFGHEWEDGTFIENPNRPEDVVGYRQQDVQELMRGFHNQDAIVARKP